MEFVGLPECQLPLAQAVAYIATAPKSNASTIAIGKALADVRQGRTLPVPEHLRDNHYRGAEHLGMFQKTPLTQRQFCAKCGGHLMATHPTLGLIDVFAATLPMLKFQPGVHINYADVVLPMRDGLPKLKDFPAEFGGSGQQLPE